MGGAGTLLAAAVAAVFLGFAVEAVGHPRGASEAAVPVRLARAVGYLALLAVSFSLCWRPWLAATATVVTLAVLRLVSEGKRRLVGEPLAFSDFALLHQAVRHPDLYYIDARMLIPAAALAGTVAAWLWLEPAVLPPGVPAALVSLAALPLGLAGVGRRALRSLAEPARRLASPIGPEPHALTGALAADEARLGLLLSLLVRLCLWSARRRAPPPQAGWDTGRPASVAPRVTVVVQLESFMDPAAVPGGFPAPNLDRARDLSLCFGDLGVPGHGAYTMRSEFAVLSGLEPCQIGEEGCDPYLSAAGRGFATLATAARGRGVRTVFVHPFRRSFFGRDRVMPALGFDTLVMEDGFGEAERIGGQVSDAAVARRILDEVGRTAGPVLVFAVTMQGHGPWRVELDPPAGTPFARYRRHMADADRAIGTLLDGLEALGEPALLCVYGDHPPILDAVGPPTAAPRTTYALVETGVSGPSERRNLSAAALGRLLGARTGR